MRHGSIIAYSVHGFHHCRTAEADCLVAVAAGLGVAEINKTVPLTAPRQALQCRDAAGKLQAQVGGLLRFESHKSQRDNPKLPEPQTIQPY